MNSTNGQLSFNLEVIFEHWQPHHSLGFLQSDLGLGFHLLNVSLPIKKS